MRFVFAIWGWVQRLPVLLVDSVIALIAIALAAVGLAIDGGTPDDRPLTLLTYALAIAVGLPLVLRRRYPWQSGMAVVALATIYQLSESPGDLEGPQWLPLMMALYAVSAYWTRRRELLLIFVAYECLVVVNANDSPLSGQAIGNATSAIATIAIGAAVRGRRERAALAEQRQQEDARRMVVDERMRIARELHDVIAHSIATINVQAGMAVHVFDSQPEEARNALREIRQVSKDALRELRTTLGVLRSSDDEEARAPSPRLDQMDDLIARTKAAGVIMSFSTSGTPRELPAAVHLTAYRIVQEALTNVVRHAGRDSQAKVAIEFSPEHIEVRVTDSGPPPGAPGPIGSAGSKLGLIGMRERVESLGGELRAGPRQGGFEVHGILPTGDVR